MLRWLIAALVGGFFVSAAWGHSWYPWECCHDRDCSPIDESRVKITPSGYVVDGKFVVPHAKVRVSPDKQFHACFPYPDMLMCFFAPTGAV